MEGTVEMKYSIDDLFAETGQFAEWDGVRNFEARNAMLRMRVGDLGFFYHSNTKKSEPGIVGVVEVVREAYPDHTAWDRANSHFDEKTSQENPRWYMVDVRLVRRFTGVVTLANIKQEKALADMTLVKRGRISVQHVSKDEWQNVLRMAEEMEK